MFTGLIEEVGHIALIQRRERLFDITVEAETVLDDVKIGDSISVNGVCLTVTATGDTKFTVQAVEETLRRTTLEKQKKGSPVNLERSLRPGDRLGGHLVQGHVDGTGRITSVKGTRDNVLISISHEPELNRYIVEKGSITVDGISLTVSSARRGEFDISVIPHTLQSTTLVNARVGNSVNLETDIISKYVEKLINSDGSLSIDQLKKSGF